MDAREEPLDEMVEVVGEPVDDDEGDDVFGPSFAAAGEDGPRHFRGQLRPSRSVRGARRETTATRASTDTRASRDEGRRRSRVSTGDGALSVLERRPRQAPETAPSSAPEAALLSPPAPSGPTRRERMASREPPPRRAAPRRRPGRAPRGETSRQGAGEDPTGKSALERRRRRRRNPFVEDDVAE